MPWHIRVLPMPFINVSLSKVSPLTSTNLQPIVSRIHHNRSQRRRTMATEASTSKAWQLATVVVPVFLTAWLTFVFSRSQDNISQEIAAQQQMLSAQLH